MARSERPTILVVDDNDPMRRLLVRILGNDFCLLAADGAAAALALCATHRGPIDLLLTDVVLPQGNGYNLSEQVRQAHPGLRTIFISGYGPEILTQCGAGAPQASSSYLAKPFATQLRARVQAVLNVRPAAS